SCEAYLSDERDTAAPGPWRTSPRPCFARVVGNWMGARRGPSSVGGEGAGHVAVLPLDPDANAEPAQDFVPQPSDLRMRAISRAWHVDDVGRDDPSRRFAQDDDPVGEIQRLVDIVRHEHDSL